MGSYEVVSDRKKCVIFDGEKFKACLGFAPPIVLPLLFLLQNSGQWTQLQPKGHLFIK